MSIFPLFYSSFKQLEQEQIIIIIFIFIIIIISQISNKTALLAGFRYLETAQSLLNSFLLNFSISSLKSAMALSRKLTNTLNPLFFPVFDEA